MGHELRATAAVVLVLASAPLLGATVQTEDFDSAATAAANGWVLYNGVSGWGWQNTNYAGGEPAEARATTYTAGIQRWYADLDLGGTLTFSEDWQASGRMDFSENSASDGGMFFGFFNRDTSLAANTQTVAGFLLVNGQLTLRFERRPNTGYIETADFGLWVSEDHTFTLSYDADGAGPGVGRLTATVTSLVDSSTTTRSLDINHALVVGATLNSFGFYAMDWGGGRYTPVGWSVDNLSYGPTGSAPYQETWTGAELLDEPRASFPTVTPTVNGTSIVLGSGNGNDKLVQLALVPAGFCAPSVPSCTISAQLNLTRLVDDSDPFILLSDGSHVIGGVIVDNLNGGAGIYTGEDLGSNWRPISGQDVLSDLGYPAIGESVVAHLLFDLRPTESLVTISFRGGTATRSLAGLDRTQALSLLLARDNEGGERHQLNSLSVSVNPTPSALADLTLSKSTVAGCKGVTGWVTLSAPAPVGGTVVAVSDTLASTTTPATIKIREGATSNYFTISTMPVAVNQTGTVTASLGRASLSQPLTVRPMGLTSVTLTPTSVVGSQPATGKATLECNAGPGPITVDLSSNNPAVASPVAASIVVPQGVKTANFDVTTTAVQAKSYATISGAANGITKSKKLTVNVAAAVSPTSLRFGSVAVGTASAPLNTTLTNNGATAVSINGIGLTGTAASWFAQTNNCPASLAAGASCTISVTFTPAAAASKSAKLSIATSATATPLSVSLSGTGVLPPLGRRRQAGSNQDPASAGFLIQCGVIHPPEERVGTGGRTWSRSSSPQS